MASPMARDLRPLLALGALLTSALLAAKRSFPTHDIEDAVSYLLLLLALAWAALRLAAYALDQADVPASTAAAAASTTATAAATSAAKTPQPANTIRILYLEYMPAWLAYKAADWMQGPYFHEVYANKMIDGKPMSESLISVMFLAGFVASMLVGTFAGPLTDSYGRRAGCIAFALLHSLGALSTLSDSLPLLLLGRACSGVAASLLQIAPEAWLISRHARLGLPPSTLQDVMGWAFFGDSIVAILAGRAATAAAEAAGATAPFLLSLVLLGLGALYSTLMWRENYGAAAAAAATDGGLARQLEDGLRATRASPAILALSITQALFEGSIMIFVLVWGSSVSQAAGDDVSVPFGSIFSCLMVGCVCGGAVVSLLSSYRVPAERFMPPVLFAAATALAAAATTVAGAAPVVRLAMPPWLKLTLCYVAFEAAVGVYFPAMGGLRSKHVPEQHRGAVMSLSRVPLNLLVIGVALGRDALGDAGSLLLAAVALVLASAAMSALGNDAKGLTIDKSPKPGPKRRQASPVRRVTRSATPARRKSG